MAAGLDRVAREGPEHAEQRVALARRVLHGFGGIVVEGTSRGTLAGAASTLADTRSTSPKGLSVFEDVVRWALVVLASVRAQPCVVLLQASGFRAALRVERKNQERKLQVASRRRTPQATRARGTPRLRSGAVEDA